jgi:hypothetical protein
MKFSTNKKGNALVDLIIGIVILGLVSISVVGAYTSLISMVTNAFRNSQTSWFGNSVMEIYSAKDFDDIAGVDDFILPQFPGYTADITVTHKDIDLSTSTFDGGNEESQYKEIIVAANNVSDNSVTLKTIISVPVEESGGAGGAGLGTFYTFTNCGQEGRTGPSQDQCNLEYGEGVVTVTVDNGIQEWTVPETGAYTIEVWGAQGGPRKGYDNDNINRGGTGAILSGDFSLTEDLVLKIIVGQRGRESGGGGGTFVAKSENIPLIVAGGGAAWCTNSGCADDADAVLTEGNGGGGGTGCGSGGGGFYGDGTTSERDYGTGGLAFVNGGTGGDGDFYQNIYVSEGGFGSGGGASNCCIGGGGGYTGGKGAAACDAKGGHSYFNPVGSNRTYIGTDNTGHGKVIITFIE